MKCIFTIDGINYLSPNKREAYDFIRFWYKGSLTVQYPRRFDASWKLERIEKAPSYGQLQRIDLSKVEF